MAITSLTYQQTGPQEYLFAYASDVSSPTFYVYINGVFVTTTLETSYRATVSIGGQLQFDVFDEAASTPPEYFPDRLTMRWQGRSGVASYRVDQYVGAAWVTRQIIPFRKSNLYHYVTPRLDDVTSYQFRAVPIDTEGRAGNALTFTTEMVRRPDAPQQTMTFTAGELVIS